MLYADDLQIYFQFPPDDFATELGKMRKDIAAVKRWASRNCLRLNTSKTEAMLLSSARYINSILLTHSIDFRFDNYSIELDTRITNSLFSLWALLVSPNTWVRSLKKLIASSGGSNSTKIVFPLRVWLFSLVFPFFDYCVIVSTWQGSKSSDLIFLLYILVLYVYFLFARYSHFLLFFVYHFCLYITFILIHLSSCNLTYLLNVLKGLTPE